ncbi:hypothetical protein ABTY98_25265 [Streptomyces sp. NPDC096040]|uniref:hypothetical protein n=1 Tax=Streptomyces sp. NPDC096040 TaxID=3155541 RepID=UPI0033184DB5
MSLGDAHLDAGDAELARICLDEAVKAMNQAGAGLRLAEAIEARAECHRRAVPRTREAEERFA